jgi:tetratricopeptide (TPR) repeat protein
LLISCGDLNAAWQETKICLRLNPDYGDAHLLQAEILHRKGNFPEAEKSARVALSIDPEKFEAHDLLGDIYLETHRAGKALACYRSALRLDPTHKPLKRKVILALQARIPFWGVFWKISSGLDRFSDRRVAEAVLLAMVAISFLLVSMGDFGTILMTCIYCVPIVVPLGLLIWVVDPMLTRAFLDGRIKIDETVDSNPKVETNTRLARFIKVPFLLLVLALTLLCSMIIFWIIGIQSQ